MIPRLSIISLALLTFVGCAAPVAQIDNPIPVHADEYDRVFDAAVEVLRDYRFVIARQDRRFGIITTQPLTAASFLEPWHADSLTTNQRAENTFNHQRRTVTVRIQPNTAAATTPSAIEPDKRYTLRVECLLHRRTHPPRMLNTAALTSTRFRQRGSGIRTLQTERGDEQSLWVPVGNDPELAQQFVHEILIHAYPSTPHADAR